MRIAGGHITVDCDDDLTEGWVSFGATHVPMAGYDLMAVLTAIGEGDYTKARRLARACQ